MADEPGLRIGSFAGAAIVIDPTVILLALFVLVSAVATSGFPGVPEALIFLAALLLAVLLHEFGHAGVAALLKLPSKRIVLTFFGGHVEFAGALKARWQEIAVSFAGPAANLLTSAAVVTFLGLAGSLPFELIIFLTHLGNVSVLLGAFNLLPGLPLDGGRILLAALSFFMARDRARLIAALCGIAIAVGLAVYAFMIGQPSYILVVLFIGLAAWAEVRAARAGLSPGAASG